jgi:hypothetical protein
MSAELSLIQSLEHAGSKIAAAQVEIGTQNLEASLRFPSGVISAARVHYVLRCIGQAQRDLDHARALTKAKL